MTQKVVILGAGLYAKEVLWVFHDSNRIENRWEVLGFIDDNQAWHNQNICDKPVLGGFDWFSGADVNGIKVICSNVPTRTKLSLVRKAEELKLGFCSIIHPSVQHSLCGSIGKGCYVGAGAVLGPDSILGNHVSVNTNAIVSHDTIIKDYVNLGPGVKLAGNAFIREGADIGIGVSVNKDIRIGKWSVVDSNAAVIKDIPNYSTVVAVPSQVIIKGYTVQRDKSSYDI